jgi:hypothetical protein
MCQYLVENAFVPYRDMACCDESMCQVDIDPHATSRDRYMVAAMTKVAGEIQSQS